MGRGYELFGDLTYRIVLDAIEAPVEPGGSLYEDLAVRYGVDPDYARQCCNDLVNHGYITLTRSGFEVIGYDLVPAVINRCTPWPVLTLLGAVRAAAGDHPTVTREDYDRLPVTADRPPSDAVVATFHLWERALLLCGLTP